MPVHLHSLQSRPIPALYISYRVLVSYGALFPAGSLIFPGYEVGKRDHPSLTIIFHIPLDPCPLVQCVRSQLFQIALRAPLAFIADRDADRASRSALELKCL